MNEDEIDIHERIEVETIAGFFPELKSNPFGLRLCQVFSSDDQEPRSMNFEDFLDMASVLSENAPPQIKADWAFRVFDFDENGLITADDIMVVVTNLCGENRFSPEDMNRIVGHVLKEAEGRDNDAISPQEFRNIMSRSPDFSLNFTIRF